MFDISAEDWISLGGCLVLAAVLVDLGRQMKKQEEIDRADREAEREGERAGGREGGQTDGPRRPQDPRAGPDAEWTHIPPPH